MASPDEQNVDRDPVEGGTIRVLVCINRGRGAANHITDGSGHPLCKTSLDHSLWQLEERPVTTTVICHRCRVAQAKLARS